VTYVQCDYWVNTYIAKCLTKGTLVELQGRIGVNAYKGNDGEAKATLTFHVNMIKIHGSMKPRFDKLPKVVPISRAEVAQAEDDLPF
jgi:single-strand DNA-binding protein